MKKKIKTPSSLIRGRFQQPVHEVAKSFSASHSVDRELFLFDIQGSLAHAAMLCSIGILSKQELLAIRKGLKQIQKELKEGQFLFQDSLEDIHMHIESRLIQIAGDAGAKLHTGRSRNDQVALDFRLYCRKAIEEITHSLDQSLQVLLLKAKEHSSVLMPGYTHLQQAQPIRASHHFLAYINMLERDRSRLQDCLQRMNELPLGCGALAGLGIGTNRWFLAKELNFPRLSENSLDTVSDRDFALELLSSISLIAMHLSRFMEEIIIWFSIII